MTHLRVVRVVTLYTSCKFVRSITTENILAIDAHKKLIEDTYQNHDRRKLLMNEQLTTFKKFIEKA